MKLVRFVREFEIPALISRKNCVLCKVWGLIVYRPRTEPYPVAAETAEKAIKAGAAIEVTDGT